MLKQFYPYRRTIQFSILLILIAIPILNLLKIDVVQGILCSIGTADYEITCALGALQSMLANREINFSLILSASFFIILAVVLGRVFCGWMCPQGLISEGGDKLRTKYFKSSCKPDSPAKYKSGRTVLLSILGAGLLATFLVGVPVICYICPIGIICRELLQGTMLYKIGGEAIILGFIFAADVFVARRGWCRYICPLGAFYSLFSKFSLTVKRDKYACVKCGTCQRVCSMGNAPIKDEINKTCINCGVCIEKCPEGALAFEHPLIFHKKPR
jgi:ferredoxin-type protein NapH